MSLLLAAFLALTSNQAMSETEILEQADARIEKHRKADAVIKLASPDGDLLPAGTTVRIEQTRHKFLFGCNIFKLEQCGSAELNAAYGQRFGELLNFATLPFYWWGYEKEPGKPNYQRTLPVLRWCKANNVTPKGHPLAWNWVDPGWLPDDPAIAMKAQFVRIETCARRFKKDIRIWDVVNEATHHDRPEPKQKAPKLTQAISDMGVGAYVREAFQAARKANPEAILIINDYRTDEAFAQNVISQLVDKDGKPLYDVIGIQSHQHGGAWPVPKIWEVCDRFARFGKPLHFTETTFLSGALGWDLKKQQSDSGFKWESTPDGEERQAREAVRFYTVLFSHPAVEAVTWWDFTDLHAWQGAPAGLLRADMTPKPVYNELMKRIKGNWWTQTETRVGHNAETRFRGFCGEYRISVTHAGKTLTGEFSLDRKTPSPIMVTLRTSSSN